ncbi:hypothetical protein [Saccharophagus degradans]|uniref:Uncharacterized protein n=1 Tax=Saccharophagus degradans TaxID=86304 RepID=A0AAW7WZE2_9GAMM|nr:hypothetical protein [Saccharophagus degradans]MDO6420855.1 hypothetical protein [Saccharophagus degradans]MDO6609704.1 hypothetical protein [Saccharophagus degradans]
MEELNSCEIYYLVALLASEEAPVIELKTQFSFAAVCDESIQRVLTELVSDGTVGIMASSLNGTKELSIDASLCLIENWQVFIYLSYRLFLTEAGLFRWETDDWGVSEKRASYLVFSSR